MAQYLGLTNVQITSIQQLNNALNRFTAPKNSRITDLQRELEAENAKPAPDPLALGQRYLEIESINREIAAQESDTRMKVAAQLTSTQTTLLQRISTAAVQSSLLADARCGFLADSLSLLEPTSIFGIVNISPFQFSYLLPGVLLDARSTAGCSPVYPISIRNFLALTDAEIASILTFQAGYNSLLIQKNNRTADVQVELRDELAKPVLDPVTLGVRYIELAEISGELAAADKTARAAARALLTPAQRTALQGLVDTSALTNYLSLAETCRLIADPPGSFTFSTLYFSGCPLN